MKRKIALVVAMLAGLFAGTAHAGFFLGAGINNSGYDYDDVGNSTGNQFYGGYYFDNGFVLEASKIDLGSADIAGLPLELRMTGSVAYLGYKSPGRVGWIGKIGSYSLNTELSGGGDSIDEDSSGLAWAIGFVYGLSDSVALRGELQSFVGVTDFAEDGDIFGGAFSVEMRF